eukprot:gb/GFBE01013476.1/.p1 GENE.gb/GFBE01013476.1/~~gb/GFBE01013476.1/.p1  ORF type:complete len:481 (+),score=81.21 gb/GFBE01013476.1/:1-1443(+)
MAAARGALLLGSAATAWSQLLLPTGEAPLGWPAATALASNQSWPMGYQPPRLSGWKMDAEGRPMTCWSTTVLHDHEKGWPGLCLGLFEVGSVSTEALCKEACWGDPRCSMWQFVTVHEGKPMDPPQCWIGYGRDCDERKGNPDSIDVAAAERLQHGAVHVYRELGKVKVNGLYSFGLFEEGTEALSIQRCRDWCYSSIVCEYWQYSTTHGCFADAPHLSSKQSTGVEYPLTSTGYITGTDEANSMVAGQYVQHYCPAQPVTDTKDDVFYDPSKDTSGGGPPVWAWIIAILLLLLLLGCLLWYFCVYSKTGSREHRSLRSASTDQDDEEYSKVEEAAKLNETMSSQADSFGPPPAPPPKQAASPPSPTSYRTSLPRPASPTRVASPTISFQPAAPVAATTSYTSSPVAYTSLSQATSCKKCGNAFAADAQFCRFCGSKRGEVLSSVQPGLLNQGVAYNQPGVVSVSSQYGSAYGGQSVRLM